MSIIIVEISDPFANLHRVSHEAESGATEMLGLHPTYSFTAKVTPTALVPIRHCQYSWMVGSFPLSRTRCSTSEQLMKNIICSRRSCLWAEFCVPLNRKLISQLAMRHTFCVFFAYCISYDLEASDNAVCRLTRGIYVSQRQAMFKIGDSISTKSLSSTEIIGKWPNLRIKF